MSLLLGTARGGDAPITDEEEHALEALLETVERLTTEEVDAWAAGAIAAHGGDGDLADVFARVSEAHRLTAAAIAQLSARDRAIIGTMIVRHPHSYFEGFHTPEDLRRAHDLATRCELVRH